MTEDIRAYEVNPSRRVLVLIYDTETTGLPLFKEPSEDPRQPHLVELCGLLYDEASREIVDSYHTLIRPDGWTIPDEVAEIHGITTERALADEIGVMPVAFDTPPALPRHDEPGDNVARLTGRGGRR